MAYIDLLNARRAQLQAMREEVHPEIAEKLAGEATPDELNATEDWLNEAYRTFQNAPKPPGYEPEA